MTLFSILSNSKSERLSSNHRRNSSKKNSRLHYDSKISPKQFILFTMEKWRKYLIMIHSPDGYTNFFNIVTGILQEDILTPYLFIFCVDYIRGAYDKFPDFFRMSTFIDRQYTHETLVPFEVISSGCNAHVVSFQQLLEGPMEVIWCEHVNDLHHILFHLLNCLITTASEIREQPKVTGSNVWGTLLMPILVK